MKSAFIYISLFIFPALIGAAAWAALNLFFITPLVYSVQPFSVDKEVYATHDTMIISSYRCNYEPNPLVVNTVERYFYNLKTGEEFHMPSSPGVVKTGCSWQDARVFDGFDETMPSGMYVKRGVTKADGRFRTVYVPWQTEPFQYVKTD